MSEQHLDQARAREAFAALEQLVEGLFQKEQGEKAAANGSSTATAAATNGCEHLKQHRSVLLTAPVMLRRHGLLQTLAFWRSKDRAAEPWAFATIVAWLAKAASTRHLVAPLPPTQLLDWISLLTRLSSPALAVLEAEAVTYAGWLKRAVDGHWLERDCKKILAENESRHDKDDAAGDDRGLAGHSQPGDGR